MRPPAALPAAPAAPVALAALVFFAPACDTPAASTDGKSTAEAAAPPFATATAVATAPPEPPRPPEIIVDAATVAIGSDRVPAGEQGLADKVAVFLNGRPAIADQAVDFVAMRNAKPAEVVAVATALRRARAAAVNVKTEARDGTTQKLPLSFAPSLASCTTTAWIAKDAAIDVWPAGGGVAKRIIKGMAGPDMTLGTEAVGKQAGGCGASELVVGADERLTWGLVFDLATMSLRAPGSRLSRAELVTAAVPGRKVALDSQ